MSRHLHAIAGRLSLRAPQRRSLEILHRVTQLAPPAKDADLQAAIQAVAAEFPSVSDFEREFPSLCFALATGVGKTRLMGAFIAYLHLEHGLNNFFVLAPNLTIYNKLIADFSPVSPKYVFKGISEFAIDAPRIITGDNYEQSAGTLFDAQFRCNINIFNIAKINSEVRGGKAPRIKRLSEYIGQSYFDYLASLPDLVLLMDESHRYRASAGVRALNELKPVLGLELTATPFVETSRGAVPFKNVIYDYPLSQAMEDGFVKEPAVVTRRDFDPSKVAPDELETIKLEDGVRLHESTKVALQTYARETGKAFVKPFMLVIARDTTHAASLVARFGAADFLGGRYADKVIQVDSSQTGAAEEAMIARLLNVERADEPTEIVIHVNMLKEGWDVTNLYTIVPLRAANAKILVEQSIGRGLRLPYGTRSHVEAVDRLNIVAHDKFQEIVDEANREGSALRLKTLILDEPTEAAPVAMVVAPTIETQLGLAPDYGAESAPNAESVVESAQRQQEQQVAQIAYRAIQKIAYSPALVAGTAALSRPEVQVQLVESVQSQMTPAQLSIEATLPPLDVAAIVAQTAAQVAQGTIDIPRIQVLPRDEVRTGFSPFALDLKTLNYVAPSDDLYLQYLRTGKSETLAAINGADERRLEDYIVGEFIEFDDVSYDDHADLLYELAGQTVAHFRAYLSEDETRKVLRVYRRDIADFIHAQMKNHVYQHETRYETKVAAGFTPLKAAAFVGNGVVRDVRQAPPQLNQIKKYVFGGFSKCLYPQQKFDSDSERKMALILERDANKWFRPVRGQFNIFYRAGTETREYQPDFVAETADTIYLIETKSAAEMQSEEVKAKAQAAANWCALASDYTEKIGGKNWLYLLIRHDAVAGNTSLQGLASAYQIVV